MNWVQLLPPIAPPLPLVQDVLFAIQSGRTGNGTSGVRGTFVQAAAVIQGPAVRKSSKLPSPPGGVLVDTCQLRYALSACVVLQNIGAADAEAAAAVTAAMPSARANGCVVTSLFTWLLELTFRKEAHCGPEIEISRMTSTCL